jgi:putative membrane protein
MVKLILRALVGALGLYLASVFVEGIHVEGLTTLLVAAVVLGIVNAIVRPVAFVLTLPLTIMTLGLFLLVLNAAMLGLTAYFLRGLSIDGFVPALFGAVVISVVSWVGHLLLGQAERRAR